MPKPTDVPTSLRIPSEDLDRASRLTETMEAATGVPVSRSSVLLAAIRAGLDVLEERNKPETTKRRR